jgi:hypothetical protein
MALARHHGAPTRLIDWTHNPLIAAFFAACNTAEGDTGDIAMWAIDRSAVHLSSGCEFLCAPRSQIGFLHA